MDNEIKDVCIYTDGACSGNPGNGGWGAVLIYKGVKKEINGGERNTTNNRMELMAAIKALEMLKIKCNVKLFSDSAYLVNAFNNGWLISWQKNNWKGSNKKQVLNIELWQRLIDLTSYHNVEFVKVKGHADNELNNRCDELARAAITSLE